VSGVIVMTEEEMILTAVKNCQRIDLYADPAPLSIQQRDQINTIKLRRQKGEPLQYLLGSCTFMGLKFKVDSRVLIPRPETELLVEAAIKILKKSDDRKLMTQRILDLGTGSGNIAIGLAKFIEECQVTAVDISQDALDLAGQNARLNGVEEKIQFVRSDLFVSFKNSLPNPAGFDMIISNPPYIPSGMITTLPADVQKEPTLALDGGMDGLDFYRRLVIESSIYLKPGGFLLFEMGDGQREAIEQIVLRTQNFIIHECVQDYRGTDRIMILEVKDG